MKRLFYIFFIGICALAGCGKAESLPGDNDSTLSYNTPEFTAIVTVKQNDAGTTFFQLDENTAVFPVNYTQPFTGIVRVICSLRLSTDKTHCQVLWCDNLEKGQVNFDAAAYDTDQKEELLVSYRNLYPDGLEILPDWMTCVEDGFLTLHYSALWGDGSNAHQLLLLARLNPEDPYELTLFHSRNGDEALQLADSIIYFDINDLPSTEGDTVTLTLNWTTLDGEAASQQFRFKSRQ